MTNKEFSEIDQLLEDGYKVPSLRDKRKVIVLVGKTGAGKSTLSKFIRNDKSLKIFITIQGFRDTRGHKKDMAVAFINKNIFDSVIEMRIVLVTDYSNLLLTGDRSAFRESLQHLATLIKDNIDSFKNAIGLIATKSPQTSQRTDNEVMNDIKVYLQETKRRLEDDEHEAKEEQVKKEIGRQITILGLILEGEGYIGFFRVPEKDVILPNTNYEQLRKLVFNDLESSSLFKNKFHVTVAPETVIYVKDVVLPDAKKKSNTILKQTKHVIMKCIAKEIINRYNNISEKYKQTIDYCGSVENTLLNFKSFENYEDLKNFGMDQKLWDTLNFQYKKLHFLHDIANKESLNKFENDAAGLFGLKENILAYVMSTARFHKFLINLLEDDQTYCAKLSELKRFDVYTFCLFQAGLSGLGFNEKTISSAANLIPNENLVEEMNQVLKLCATPNPEMKTVDKTTIFFGQRIVLSHIISEIRNQSNKIHTIAIVAASSFYIDCDVNLQNTHFTILAPQVIVHKNRILRLNGEDGAFHPKEKTDFKIKALHGNPGFSSGSFRMFANSIKNSSLLHITSVGGNGSDGQNGSDGKNAEIKSAPHFTDDYEGEEETIKSEIEKPGYEVVINDGDKKEPMPTSAKVGIVAGSILAVSLGAFALPVVVAVGATGMACGATAVASTAVVAGSAIIETEREHSKTLEAVYKNKSGPTNGEDGGDAGSGARAGEIQIVASHQHQIILDNRSGISGKRGSGGKAGSNAPMDFRATCELKGKKKSRFYGLFGDFKYKAARVKKENGKCFSGPINGRNGAEKQAELKYKFPQFPIYKLVIEICNASLTIVSREPSIVSLLLLIFPENNLMSSEGKKFLQDKMRNAEGTQKVNLEFLIRFCTIQGRQQNLLR
ncbi:uncharacterized protein LOC132194655 isoform X2 [Neocloeon triangulifer]|uniref:uncharacterized protein LOC132194655 isoform X2 n=1 Tax=Neocloeon triangulifer TaxID=2078957 RepID=UPI00286EF68B|nr:uncharacterized protein LOC132194655 isoform X2 [Neocloeon triangulifer]